MTVHYGKKIKSFLSQKVHRVELISDSSALSQTIDEIAGL